MWESAPRPAVATTTDPFGFSHVPWKPVKSLKGNMSCLGLRGQDVMISLLHSSILPCKVPQNIAENCIANGIVVLCKIIENPDAFLIALIIPNKPPSSLLRFMLSFFFFVFFMSVFYLIFIHLHFSFICHFFCSFFNPVFPPGFCIGLCEVTLSY